MFTRTLLITVCIFLGSTTAHAQWTPPTPVVTATTVQKEEIEEGLKLPGSFKAVEDVILRAQIAGEITEVAFEDGMVAREGQVLFMINDREMQAQLKKAKADAKMHNAQLKRAKELHGRGFQSPAELEKIEAQAAQAQAQLAIAQEGVSKTKVIAPFDGVLSSRKVSRGAYVKPFDALVRLQTLTPIRFEFQVPANKLTLLQDQQNVTASSESFPGQTFTGKVVIIEPRADEKTRNVRVLAEFPNVGAQLIPGSFGTIILTTADKHEALVIPEEALVVRRDGLYVYIVEETPVVTPEPKKQEGADETKEEANTPLPKAKLVKVNVGIRSKDRVEIISGLKEGDKIVLQGQEKIHDNADIEVYKPQG